MSSPVAASSQPDPHRAFELSQRETIALSAVRDRNEQLDETALYMMLDKAALMAHLPSPSVESLDHPSADNLLRHPQRYRGWPVRLDVNILRVEELTSPKDITAPPDWPADKSVWKMAGYIPSATGTNDTPLLVLSTGAPEALGQPSSVGPDGEGYYDHHRTLTAAGFFYKLYRGQDDSGRTRDFPVLIAWSFENTQSQSGIALPGNFGIMILVGLVVFYVFARRWARRATGPEPTYHYRPLREDLHEPERQASNNRGKENPRAADADSDS